MRLIHWRNRKFVAEIVQKSTLTLQLEINLSNLTFIRILFLELSNDCSKTIIEFHGLDLSLFGGKGEDSPQSNYENGFSGSRVESKPV